MQGRGGYSLVSKTSDDYVDEVPVYGTGDDPDRSTDSLNGGSLAVKSLAVEPLVDGGVLVGACMAVFNWLEAKRGV